MEDSKNLQRTTEQVPTHEEIQKRAYDLYSKSGQDFSAKEHWLMAEEQLKKERAMDDAKPSKTQTAVAGKRTN
jgi:hypothetical protein